MLRDCMRLVHFHSQLESHDFNVGGVLRYRRISFILFIFKPLYISRCTMPFFEFEFFVWIHVCQHHDDARNSLINAVRSAKYREILSTRVSTSEASEILIIIVFNHFYLYCEILYFMMSWIKLEKLRDCPMSLEFTIGVVPRENVTSNFIFDSF